MFVQSGHCNAHASWKISLPGLPGFHVLEGVATDHVQLCFREVHQVRALHDHLHQEGRQRGRVILGLANPGAVDVRSLKHLMNVLSTAAERVELPGKLGVIGEERRGFLDG